MQDQKTIEKGLIELVKQGDESAFVELVTPCRERLFRKAYSIIGNPDDAEDILQESLISAYRAIHSFRGESGIYTWLYRIVVNRCRDFLRSSGGKKKLEALDPFTMVVKDERPGVEKKYEHSEASSYLIGKVENLSGKYKKILLMRYYDELSYQEISDLLHVNVGTVKSRLFKARELLKRSILADGLGEDYFGKE